jgi:hypothetical protein
MTRRFQSHAQEERAAEAQRYEAQPPEGNPRGVGWGERQAPAALGMTCEGLRDGGGKGGMAARETISSRN